MKGIEEVADILVVEGSITEGQTVITLSRSIRLHDNFAPVFVNDAVVFVEREDGLRFYGELQPIWGWLGGGRYVIETGTLDVNQWYRLRIKIDEHEYVSDSTHPIQTPEIDSIFWRKEGRGEPVVIYVSTHDPNNQIFHYQWSFTENWEINSWREPDTAFPLPTRCWNSERSANFVLGSGIRTGGRVIQPITEIVPTNQKLSVLYRITVRQNAISRRAFEYFENIQKNTDLSGSIFAPTPSELRGNIVNTTDPQRPVVGFIDVSTTTQKSFFISRREGVYEPLPLNCRVYTADTLESWFGNNWQEMTIPNTFVPLPFDPDLEIEQMFTYRRCVDCRFLGGTTRRPENWPN